MTVVVAAIDGNCVVVGSDSASCRNIDEINERKGSSKAWEFTHCGVKFIAGFAGNFAEGNFIRYSFHWPIMKTKNVESWLHSCVQPNLNKALRERFEDRVADIEWELLLAVKVGSSPFLYRLSQCGDVEESASNFTAIGSGGISALACLETLKYESNLTSWEKVDLAMHVSAKLHSTVRGPFHMLALV